MQVKKGLNNLSKDTQTFSKLFIYMQVPVLVARKSIILTQHLALQFIVTRYGEKRPHTVNVFLLHTFWYAGTTNITG